MTALEQYIKGILANHYSLELFSAEKMDGYDSINFRLKTDQGKFVLKLYEPSEGLVPLLEAENEVMAKLAKELLPVVVSHPIANQNGAYLTNIEVEKYRIARLLNFVEGTFLGEAERSDALYQSYGSFIARMDQALLTHRNNAIEARFFEWDNQHFLMNEPYLPYITDASNRKRVAHFILQFKEKVLPHQYQLRRSIIHSDPNEWNTLANGDQIGGIIDFGDMVHSYLINELAIGIAYTLLDQANPLAVACQIVRAYHAVLPLEELELELLYYLVAARLSTSVLHSSYNQHIRPENTYISVSQKGAFNLLEEWVSINPIHASNEFKKAANFEPDSNDQAPILLDKRREHFSKTMSISYSHQPIHMKGAAFQYMYDAYGGTYLDAYNNIPLVGHSHPKVVAACQRQMAQLNTNTRYLYDQLYDYAEQLLAKFPPSLNKVFFVNSGSAASDLAIRLAHAHSSHKQLMVMEHGYHGNTQIGIDISAYKFDGKGGEGAKSTILTVPMPDTYRGKYRTNDPQAAQRYAKDALQMLHKNEEGVAAFIAESIIGCGGQVMLPDGYLKEIYPHIRAQGGVCIADEVQVGFGRLGSHFWGFELQGVTPDIVILGKPMGNGHPLAAVVTTQAIAESFETGMEFFSSFGGNPVSCAIGLAVLDVLEEEKLPQNALITGRYFQEQLNLLKAQYPVIGDVRGAGLFLGIEFVKNPDTLAPATELTAHIKNALKDNYILSSTDGPYESVLKVKPPLCFNQKNVDRFVEVLDGILKKCNL